MPLGFFNHCWKAHRFAHITDACELVSYHATCEAIAKSKREAMNHSVAMIDRNRCATPREGVLTEHQLNAFMRRSAQPTRLYTMQTATL